MKTRKNIRDAFKYNAGSTSDAPELATAVITSLAPYSNINNVWIYYTLSATPKKISFTDAAANV